MHLATPVDTSPKDGARHREKLVSEVCKVTPLGMTVSTMMETNAVGYRRCKLSRRNRAFVISAPLTVGHEAQPEDRIDL